MQAARTTVEPRKPGSHDRRHTRRKNLNLDQRLIDRARRALGASTETEAITRALDAAIELAAFRVEIAAGARAMYGKGGFAHVDDAAALDFRNLYGLPVRRS